MKIRISIFIFLSTQNVFSLRQYKTREIFSLIHLTHSNFNFLKIGYYTRELEEISDKQDHTNHQHLETWNSFSKEKRICTRKFQTEATNQSLLSYFI
ncbi:hypothetical protein GS511_03115 [Leptospira borgpetersenii]|uniref:Uncharacterized protein n=1 Tax=Leptospira borgpetersenii serovar Ballum TaxID=280505 RepID=A0A0S2IN26_LEPBO|nr:hypothetical protein LBBP_00734 [Leptospira borgpetersenii serovar Ballum]QHE26082.1 hypothetical protein GS524_03115 [Leptospira borgpetersenii]OOV46248.1 hypothetical protein B1H38_00095 [Leptospira borgpetersenii serovar Ballum]QHE29386.1 hypothetical protein GS523_03120 [Leptospira borgpetersenii]QHE32687.1 hypothetical protein GS517_03115 [Leptospira borgpetersenii]